MCVMIIAIILIPYDVQKLTIAPQGSQQDFESRSPLAIFFENHSTS